MGIIHRLLMAKWYDSRTVSGRTVACMHRAHRSRARLALREVSATFIDMIIATSFALLAGSVILAVTGGGPRDS